MENVYVTARQTYSGQDTKFYQNWLGFMEDMIKTFRVFFGSQCILCLYKIAFRRKTPADRNRLGRNFTRRHSLRI